MSNRTKYQVEEVRAGVDWITMTMRPEEDTNDRWYLECLHRLCVVRDMGYTMEERKLLGYQGYSAGNCFVGVRDDGVIAQFSGFRAHDAFLSLYRTYCHVSRIDLQVTVRYRQMPSHVAKEAYRDAINHNNGLAAHRRRKLYIIVGSDGGDTCYVGSASSEQRGRIYNKEVQSEDPNYVRTWRYECMYRNSRAEILAAGLVGRIGDVERAITSIVSRWYSERGISCRFDTCGDIIPLPLIKTLPTDVERKLKWLREQVRPTIAYLLDLGMLDEVDTALGTLGTYFARREEVQ